MRSPRNKFLWTTSSDSSDSTYMISSTDLAYESFVHKVEIDLEKTIFKAFEAQLTKKRDELRKKKTEYIFNPNDLDLEGEEQ